MLGKPKIKPTEDFAVTDMTLRRLKKYLLVVKKLAHRYRSTLLLSPHHAKDMQVHIHPKWKKTDRLVLEDYDMCKLQSVEPVGLNTKHGMFAKLIYNDY